MAKGVALLWGPTIALAVVATGNHFFFDIAAGLVVSALGYAVAVGIDRVRLRNPYPGLAPGFAGA